MVTKQMVQVHLQHILAHAARLYAQGVHPTVLLAMPDAFAAWEADTRADHAQWCTPEYEVHAEVCYMRAEVQCAFQFPNGFIK